MAMRRFAAGWHGNGRRLHLEPCIRGSRGRSPATPAPPYRAAAGERRWPPYWVALCPLPLPVTCDSPRYSEEGRASLGRGGTGESRRFKPAPSPRMRTQICPSTRFSAPQTHKLTHAFLPRHSHPLSGFAAAIPAASTLPRRRSRSRCSCRYRHCARRRHRLRCRHRACRPRYRIRCC